MISIVDYGLGNIRAFLNVYRRLNIEATTVTTASELQTATKLILPGVGNFDGAMQRLNDSGMREALDHVVLEKRVPVLGICVGMQMLGASSEEGRLPGLGWLQGSVKSLATNSNSAGACLPHMGWNDVQPTKTNRLFDGLETDARFYFLHSFYFDCCRSDDVAATADYGFPFSCAISAVNIHGVQFHPEKSHQFGTRLLKNFAEL